MTFGRLLTLVVLLAKAASAMSSGDDAAAGVAGAWTSSSSISLCRYRVLSPAAEESIPRRDDGQMLRGEDGGNGSPLPPAQAERQKSFFAGAPSFAASEGSATATYRCASLVSLANASFNALRPDPALVWQMRVPRVLWELCISLVAELVRRSGAPTAAGRCTATGGASAAVMRLHHPGGTGVPALCLLLAIMTGSTALIDAFFWAPIFAMAASFESCTGGGFFSRKPRVCREDYVKGMGRILVSIQCVLTAVFYLATAITAWGDFVSVRDVQVARRDATAFRAALDVT